MMFGSFGILAALVYSRVRAMLMVMDDGGDDGDDDGGGDGGGDGAGVGR